MINENIEKKNQKKFFDKRTGICYLIGFIIAFFQNFSSSTGNTLYFVFIESLAYACGMGLIYMIPFWVICKAWDFFFSFKKSLRSNEESNRNRNK